MNFDEYFETLGLDKNEPLTKELLAKTFRRAALKNHPDKGGDPNQVMRSNMMYHILISINL
jgi:DnaJ family protein A protein 2